MIVLGIETTCDETAAAVVERSEDGRGKILSNIVLSQVSEHAAFGGVVPEIAARAHVEALDAIIAKAMSEAVRGYDALDGVAAAAGPGLIGGVIVGLTTAKAIALVNEQAADRGQSSRGARAHRAPDRLRRHFPIACSSPPAATPRSWRCAASAIMCASAPRMDDAIGEAFDKTAKLLGPGLSGRPAGRARGHARRRHALRAAAADAGPQGCRFLALRTEDGAAAGSGKDRAAVRPGRGRPVRLVPAGGGRRRARPAARRLAHVSRAIWRALGAGCRRRRRRQSGDPQGACIVWPSRSAPCWWRRRSNCAPTTAP